MILIQHWEEKLTCIPILLELDLEVEQEVAA
jgi:hypothetical protein